MARSSSVARGCAVVLALSAFALACPGPALAGSTWDGIRKEAYGARPILDGTGVVQLTAPGRPENQSRVPIAIEARLGDGRTIKAVSFIVDENPSPMAAVFHMGPGRDHVKIATHLRLNAQTDVHAVVELSDGALYMVGQLVKFAGGQASCSAPPMGDPKEIAATMGRMELAEVKAPGNASPINRPAHLTLSHPNHTGMVLDQQTLLYTPLLMVERMAVRQGGEPVFEMEGSITLSQNPEIDFDFKSNGAVALEVSVADTGGGTWGKSFPIGPSS